MIIEHTIPNPINRSSRRLNWDAVMSRACCMTVLMFVGGIVTRAVDFWDVVPTSSSRLRLTAPHRLVAPLSAAVRGWVTQLEGIMVMPMLTVLILSDFPGHTILEDITEEDNIILAPVQSEHVGTKSVK